MGPGVPESFGSVSDSANPFAVLPDGFEGLALAGIKHVLEAAGRSQYIHTMRQVAGLLNEMVEAGVLVDYAVFGAVAQMRYTEAVATLDADVLVSLPVPDGLDLLRPVYAFCQERGYQPEGEAIRVDAWPVQFIPVFSALTQAAVRDAEEADLDGVPLRVVRADYLAVIALSVGRARDLARVIALRESGAVTDAAVAKLADQHDLGPAWTSFLKRFDEG